MRKFNTGPQTLDRGPQTLSRQRAIRCLPFSMSLFLAVGWTTPLGAQDEVPVPPLEAGVILALHPIAVHFAIALTVFGLLLDCLGSFCRRSQWQQSGRLCFFAGVVAMGFAVLSGWIELQLPRPTGAFDTEIRAALFYHEYLGYSLLGLFIMLAVARLQIRNRLPALFVIASFIGLLGLAVQGYFGGEMVHRYGAGVRAVHILSATVTETQQKASKQDSEAVSEQ